MPKATRPAKKRTRTKPLNSKKKTMSAAEMKKVKGGITDSTLTTSQQQKILIGLLVPAVQKVRE